MNVSMWDFYIGYGAGQSAGNRAAFGNFNPLRSENFGLNVGTQSYVSKNSFWILLELLCQFGVCLHPFTQGVEHRTN